MSGGRRAARNRRQRKELFGVVRSYRALLASALAVVTDLDVAGEIREHDAALRARVEAMEGTEGRP